MSLGPPRAVRGILVRMADHVSLRTAIQHPGIAKKAIMAGVTGIVGSFVVALSDGAITIPEVLVAVLTGVTAALGVFQTPNDSLPE